MCFACPSVTSSVGGIPEVVEDGKTGRLVPFGDTTAMAAAVEELIRNPGQRKILGQAAQVRARQLFSAEVIVPQYEAVYRRVCGLQ
jgi:glycosyltransferase involved in cell wall biosynthesis